MDNRTDMLYKFMTFPMEILHNKHNYPSIPKYV